jgi:catechol 2,3-dioxygenase-like lactoylglutathione lyase family enzyme
MQEIATTTRRGIPTAINIDHYGYVVPDLEQAVAFFTDALGFELLSLDDPIAFSDDSLARWYHVHPRAAARFAFLRMALRSSNSPSGRRRIRTRRHRRIATWVGGTLRLL